MCLCKKCFWLLGILVLLKAAISFFCRVIISFPDNFFQISFNFEGSLGAVPRALSNAAEQHAQSPRQGASAGAAHPVPAGLTYLVLASLVTPWILITVCTIFSPAFSLPEGLPCPTASRQDLGAVLFAAWGRSRMGLRHSCAAPQHLHLHQLCGWRGDEAISDHQHPFSQKPAVMLVGKDHLAWVLCTVKGIGSWDDKSCCKEGCRRGKHGQRGTARLSQHALKLIKSLHDLSADLDLRNVLCSVLVWWYSFFWQF